MPENSHTEIELKLRLLNPENWAKVLSAPVLAELDASALSNSRMEACYFDSSEHELQQAGIAYRIRREGDQWVATVKAGGTSAGGLHQRQEWNVPVVEPLPSPEYFRETEVGPLLADILGDKPLIPLFNTAFDRQIITVSTPDGSKIELAVDIGVILAGDRQEPIAEVELELLEGNSEAVLRLGAELSRTVPLVVEPRSKYFRGLLLAGLAINEYPEEEPEPLTAATSVHGACRLLITHQLHQVFRAEQAFLQKNEDRETLHQFRIQLRRLRSLLSFVKPLVQPEEYSLWQTRLQSWSRTTNSLREVDVILDTWQEIITAGRLDLQPPPWLEMMLQTERSSLVTALCSTLSGGQSTPMLLEFWAWLAGEAFSSSEAELSWALFAPQRLSGWLDNMRKLAKDLPVGDPAKTHQLRILGKKLRYSLESLPLKDRKTRVLLARLKRLQDSLGVLRDGHTMNETLNGWLSSQASRVLYRDAGILLGWIARDRQEADRTYEKQWQKFKRASRRWQKDKDSKLLN